jgi:hypothetical protein
LERLAPQPRRPNLLAAQLVRATRRFARPAAQRPKGIVSRLPITPRLLPTPRSGAGYASFRASEARIVVSAWMFSIR